MLKREIGGKSVTADEAQSVCPEFYVVYFYHLLRMINNFMLPIKRGYNTWQSRGCSLPVSHLLF